MLTTTKVISPIMKDHRIEKLNRRSAGMAAFAEK
jgi:hypothetical protein